MSRVADRGSCSNADTEHNVGGDDPLTTKEGWRRFVDHQSQPPGLHAAAELARLSPGERADYDEARRGYHADLPVVNTPTIQKVISTSRLLMQLNRNQVSARRGVIISGASGTGKTTALTQLGRTHERHTRKRYPADRHRLPILYVTVPPAATARMLAVEFARFLEAWSFPAEPISPTSSTRSAPPPQTRVSSWSVSMSCTTSTWPPAPARRCPTS